MMLKACSCELYKPCLVGREDIEVSHLQFADDSSFFGEAKDANLTTLKSVLRCFEWHSGLKINFCKSCLFTMGVKECAMGWAEVLNCRIEEMPFSYLGLPISVRPCDKRIWKKVVDSMSNRLTLWENKYLSFGGRIVLLNSVLTSIPT